MKLDSLQIKNYLESVLQATVELKSVEPMGGEKTKDSKSFGYGKPYLIRCVVNGSISQFVLETMSENSFGHDHFSDRAQNLLWYHSASNQLPKHAKSLDVGAFTKHQQMISLGNAEEFFVISEFVSGNEYAADLKRLQSSGVLTPLDVRRAEVLAEYLAEIHSIKQPKGSLYIRRIRELLGHGECIMGLIDNFPPGDPIVTQPVLQEVEMQCVRWRWKLKPYIHRLCQVHGDFHPWNILFQEETNFRVLDRSRGEFGEPADDVTSLTVNYMFQWLQGTESRGAFNKLFNRFWEAYLARTGDSEILTTVQPFYAWRILVLLNPLWYPHLSSPTRQSLLRLLQQLLALDRFEPNRFADLL